MIRSISHLKWIIISAVLVLAAAVTTVILIIPRHSAHPAGASAVSAQSVSVSKSMLDAAVDDSAPMPKTNGAFQVNSLRAVFVAAITGKDFPSKAGLSAAAQKAEINGIVDKIVSLGMNMAVVETMADGQAIYQSNKFPWAKSLTGTAGNDPGYDPLAEFISAAHKKGVLVQAYVSPYRVQNISGSVAAAHPDWTVTCDGSLYLNPGIPSVTRMLESEVKSLAQKYDLDGIMLGNAGYPSTSFDDSKTYSLYGAGKPPDEWRRQNVTLLEKTIFRAVRSQKQHMTFGVESDAVWANKKQNADGSDTASSVQGYSDHFADTRLWVKSGWLDYICPKNYSAMGSFEPNANWWAKTVSGTGVTLYFGQAVYKTQTSESGWSSPDQIVRQLQFLGGVSASKGSVFYNYRDLTVNKGGVTDSIAKYFSNQLDATFGKDLVVGGPKDGLVTNESHVTITGTSDSNFPLYLNGKAVDRSSKGLFAQVVSLKPGKNVFALSHKGKTVNIVVNYSVDVLKSVSPTGKIAESGGTQINVVAVAHKDAAVYASLGGIRIQMSPAVLSSGDNSDAAEIPTDFSSYMGTITLPASKSSAQNLGRIEVTASWNGFKKTAAGAAVSVKAFARAPAGSKQIATLKPIATDTNKQYIETYLYNDDKYRPVTYPQQPGAWDYVETNGDGSPKVYSCGNLRYYKLSNGEMIYCGNASVNPQAARPNNTIRSASQSDYDNGRYTRFTFGFTQKITYTAGTNASYANLSANHPGVRDYTVNSFSATQFQITFYNTTGTPSAGKIISPLISSVDCRRVSDTSVQYVFHLKNRGVFYGTYIFYDSKGNLIIDFKNPWNGDFSKLRIAIDAGHGAQDSGALSPTGKSPNEKDINLKFALAVRDKLIRAGVPSSNILMIRTSDNYTDLMSRTVKMINWRPDFTLCIHNNASDGTASGVETYYFQPFSQPLVKGIQSRLVQAYRQSMADGSYRAPRANYNPDRGARFSSAVAYYSCRQIEMPSTLVECGFTDNPYDYQFLTSGTGTDRITNALRDGVLDFMRSEIPYSGGSRASSSSLLSSISAMDSYCAKKEENT